MADRDPCATPCAESPPKRRKKGGRKALKGGATRELGRHDGVEGRDYRCCWEALEQERGPLTALGRLEAGRVSVAFVQLRASTRALVDAQRARRTGRGRRPSARQIERLARRQGLADATFSQALERFKELTRERRRSPATEAELAELVARERAR